MYQAETKRRVLLVDDDADVRDVLGDLLGEAGHTVLCAKDGADGLRQARDAHPDVVLLDLVMPDCDGWQFRLAQRADPALSDTPVVVMSASDSPVAAAVDADLYLRKPVEGEVVLRAIEHAIAARARRRESAELIQTERLVALGTIAASLAHEINNPLTYLLLQLSQAIRSLPRAASDVTGRRVPEIQALLEGALDGAERIRSIMSGIRTFARPGDASVAPIDVRVPLDAALRLVANELRHRARLVKRYADVPPVIANEARLGQVFLNVLTNAVQAMPEGAPDANVLSVGTAIIDGDVVVEISDTGGGIPPHVLDRIFEPFFSTKPAGQGTGLGLPISRDIVASCGGRITVDSEVGRGATFRIALPAHPVSASELAAP